MDGVTGYHGFQPPRPGQEEDILSESNVKNGVSIPAAPVGDPLLGCCVDNVRLKGVECYTGRGMECEGHDSHRVQRGCHNGTREYVFSDLQSP